MTTAFLARRALVGACVLLASSQVPRAEVSVDPHAGDSLNVLVMGIVDDTDPITQVVWQPFRSIPAERILNPDGFLRGDGSLDLAVHPATGWPSVVWAYNAGAHRDVAFAEWDGGAWSATAFLTGGPTDDLDPRVFVEPDGTVHVTWWTDGPVATVFVRTRPAGSAIFGPAFQVSEGLIPSRRPSAAVTGGIFRVAYERDSAMPGAAQEIVVATAGAGGAFGFEVVASTTRSERLDVKVHSEAGHLWLDWKHDAAEFGCAEHAGGGWVAGPPGSWSDHSWVGTETTRKAVRGSVLAP
jgi:hypothetical protein